MVTLGDEFSDKLKRQEKHLINREYQVGFVYSEPDSVTDSEKVNLSNSFSRTLFAKGVAVKGFSMHPTGVMLHLSLDSTAVLSKVVNSLKTLSSRKTKSEQKIRKSGLWARGYSARTIGEKLTFDQLIK